MLSNCFVLHVYEACLFAEMRPPENTNNQVKAIWCDQVYIIKQSTHCKGAISCKLLTGAPHTVLKLIWSTTKVGFTKSNFCCWVNSDIFERWVDFSPFCHKRAGLCDYECLSSVCRAGVGSSPTSQWDFWGSTLVTSSYVRLTPDERSKQGSIWNTVVRKECRQSSYL